MQLLEVPHTHQDMVASVSLKGITFLKDGRYKRRHFGAPDYVQCPTKGFVSKRQYKAQHPQEFPAKRKPRNPIPHIAQPRSKEYTINKKVLTHRILGYTNSMPGRKRLYHWTITFHEGTPDSECCHLFRKWLIRLKTDEGLKAFSWVKERQENGTMHFHMTVHQYMDVKRCNRYMRACMMRSKDEGRVTMSRESIMKYNGVDISKNRETRRVTNFALRKNQKALARYLTKYVSKNEGTFDSLAWHNSREYTNVVTHFNFTSPEYYGSSLYNRIDRDKPLTGEWFTFYRWRGEPPDSVKHYLATVNQYIQSLN